MKLYGMNDVLGRMMDELHINSGGMPKEVDHPHPIPEQVQIEVVMLFGFNPMLLKVFESAEFRTKDAQYEFTYWPEVWDWLVRRMPEICQQGAYPTDWATREDHGADMKLLTQIHVWQRAKLMEERHGRG